MIYLGIGSNIQPQKHFVAAIQALAESPSIQLMATSPWYRTAAITLTQQPDYLNGVLALESKLTAFELLDLCQEIERKQQRIRRFPQQARTLDLDVLLYHHQRLSNLRCQLPHPRLNQRRFTLQPLHDLNPNLRLPNGRAIKEFLPCTQQQPLKIAYPDPISTFNLSCYFQY